MKDFLREYVNIITGILCAILFSLGFYNLFINLLHQNYINKEIVVTVYDKNYNTYQDNVTKIKKNLDSYQYVDGSDYNIGTMEKLRSKLKLCHEYLTKEESFGYISIDKVLKPFDLYRINANFTNEIVNKCWISGMGFITLENNNYKGYFKDVFPQYNKIVNILVDNSNYLKLELMNNSSYHYSTSITSNTIRNELLEQYNLLAKNHVRFSEIILEISEFLSKGVY